MIQRQINKVNKSFNTFKSHYTQVDDLSNSLDDVAKSLNVCYRQTEDDNSEISRKLIILGDEYCSVLNLCSEAKPNVT